MLEYRDYTQLEIIISQYYDPSREEAIHVHIKDSHSSIRAFHDLALDPTPNILAFSF